jgi:hypothetical protein
VELIGSNTTVFQPTIKVEGDLALCEGMSWWNMTVLPVEHKLDTPVQQKLGLTNYLTHIDIRVVELCMSTFNVLALQYWPHLKQLKIGAVTFGEQQSDRIDSDEIKNHWISEFLFKRDPPHTNKTVKRDLVCKAPQLMEIHLMDIDLSKTKWDKKKRETRLTKFAPELLGIQSRGGHVDYVHPTLYGEHRRRTIFKCIRYLLFTSLRCSSRGNKNNFIEIQTSLSMILGFVGPRDPEHSMLSLCVDSLNDIKLVNQRIQNWNTFLMKLVGFLESMQERRRVSLSNTKTNTNTKTNENPSRVVVASQTDLLTQKKTPQKDRVLLLKRKS